MVFVRIGHQSVADFHVGISSRSKTRHDSSESLLAHDLDGSIAGEPDEQDVDERVFSVLAKYGLAARELEDDAPQVDRLVG